MQTATPVDDTIVFAQAEKAENREPSLYEDAVGNVHTRQLMRDRAYRPFLRRQRDRVLRLGFLILEVFIGFRVFLKAIAANPESGFASLVYGLTEPFLAPFSGLIRNPTANNASLEISSMIAMVVYMIFFWLMAYALHIRSER
jgi:uncharacterized protein YggT (Ycf19 family)